MNTDHPRLAFILHLRPYRETSLLVEAFGRAEGRMTLLGKGARGGTRRGESLHPFTLTLLRWKDSANLPLLRGHESAETARVLTGAPLFCALYLNELLLNFLERHDPHPALFDAYRDTLAVLSENHQMETALRRFELALLRETGYGPTLDCESISGQPVLREKTYRYQVEQGLLADTDGTDLLSGATLLALHEGRELSPAQLREAKGLTRRLIHHHLEGRPLKSRDLFRLSPPT